MTNKLENYLLITIIFTYLSSSTLLVLQNSRFLEILCSVAHIWQQLKQKRGAVLARKERHPRIVWFEAVAFGVKDRGSIHLALRAV